MDVIGPIIPPTFKGYRFILAIIDYFSKWAEVVPLKEVKTPNVIKFIKHHVLYRFSVPDKSFTIMDLNSSVKYFKSSVIESKSKV